MSVEQRDSLHVRLHEIIDELVGRGVSMFSARSGPLRIQRVRLAGLLPFQHAVEHPYEFDFDRISGQVVALVGRNGHGKSTFVESAVGAIFGHTFSRGPLNDIAINQETQWQVGADFETATGSWRIERRRGGVAVVRPGEKQPVARGRDGVATWVRANVPSPGVLMAGAFGAQRHRGHLLQLEPAPARDVVLSMLGLDVYQAISRAAGERMHLCDAESATQTGRLDELQRAVNADHGVDDRILLIVEQLGEARDQLVIAQDAFDHARASAPDTANEAMRVRKLAQTERELRDARARLSRHEAELARVENAPPPADLDALDAVVAETRESLSAARKLVHGVEQRVHHAKDARIAKLRVAVTELGLKRKDAPTASVRVILEDNQFAQQIQQDIRTFDDLQQAVSVAEKAHETAARTAMHARANVAPVVDVVQLRAVIADARVDVVNLEEEAETLHAAHVQQEPACDIDALSADVQTKQRTISRMEHELAVCKARVVRANEARMRLDEQTEIAAQLTVARHEWWLICDLFGRTGIQGDAITEIGPQIDEHANKLLDECADGRWVVKTESTAKGEENGRETFEIWVYDRQQDVRWKNGRHLSPGESGIVGEAIAGAIAIIANAAHPHVRPTIVRDEVAVDIDRLDARTWMRILRRESELLNASGVLVVSHDRNVVAACDARMLVANGNITEMKEEVSSG